MNQKIKKSFEERYVDYMLSIQHQSILLEMEYFKHHNKLDVMKLDHLIDSSFEEVFQIC